MQKPLPPLLIFRWYQRKGKQDDLVISVERSSSLERSWVLPAVMCTVQCKKRADILERFTDRGKGKSKSLTGFSDRVLLEAKVHVSSLHLRM